MLYGLNRPQVSVINGQAERIRIAIDMLAPQKADLEASDIDRRFSLALLALDRRVGALQDAQQG